MSDLAVIGAGSRLEVYDVSTPTLPLRVAGLDLVRPQVPAGGTVVQ